MFFSESYIRIGIEDWSHWAWLIEHTLAEIVILFPRLVGQHVDLVEQRRAKIICFIRLIHDLSPQVGLIAGPVVTLLWWQDYELLGPCARDVSPYCDVQVVI